MTERNAKILELLRLPENSRCADCGKPDPVWASGNVGVFVCLVCSGVHRISSIGRVKSTQLDYLEHDLIEFMKSHGNQKAKDIYEAYVPQFYYRPTEKDCMVLKEQWIRAKYERKEFTVDKESVYAIEYKEGYLKKKGRDNKQFQDRLFVYSEDEGVLKYYIGDRTSDPKGKFPIQTLNAMFQVEKIKNQNGLEITCVLDNRTRSIFVYHDNGAEIVTWYNVLRYARYKYLKKNFPDIPETELIPKITRNYAKSGYMEKTGPTQKEAFKKRWFNLDSEERTLLYYKKPLVRPSTTVYLLNDHTKKSLSVYHCSGISKCQCVLVLGPPREPYELGRVFIGSTRCGYQALESVPRGVKRSKWDFGITISTPDRDFVVKCENTKEQKEWLEAIRSIMSRPMTENDAREEARFRESIRQ